MPSRKDKSEVGDFINVKNYNKAIDKWAYIDLHCRYLLPFLAIHEAARSKSEDKNKIWFWDEDNAIEKCIKILDCLLGEWRAKRPSGKGKTKKNKRIESENFINTIKPYVKKLTRKFNKYNIISLKDIANLKSEDRDEIRRTIINYVSKISEVKVKKGRGSVSATLGAKTLHHFFPSVIPVYDQDVIHNDSEQKDYEEYLNNCIEGISKSRSLKQVRCKIAKDYIRTELIPYNLIKNKRSILYRLDAKLAEYCLIGHFYRK